jgi:hypothetical protein
MTFFYTYLFSIMTTTDYTHCMRILISTKLGDIAESRREPYRPLRSEEGDGVSYECRSVSELSAKR